jgi:hypothetical protein
MAPAQIVWITVGVLVALAALTALASIGRSRGAKRIRKRRENPGRDHTGQGPEDDHGGP